jgi:F5/8 type C domain
MQSCIGTTRTSPSRIDTLAGEVLAVPGDQEGSSVMPLRKRTSPIQEHFPEDWLPLEESAEIEVSSEDPEWPIEGALLRDTTRGWRAAQAGAQTLRIRFDEPQTLSAIHLEFEEEERERLQEFALQWSDDRGRTFRAIVRQQFSFSPAGATREVEHYTVDLVGVTDVVLHVNPDISGRPVLASLAALRLR